MKCPKCSEDLKARAKKIVQIGDALLILGDSLEIMPTLGKVELIVTDPPYGIGLDFVYRHGTLKKESIHEQKEWNDAKPPYKCFQMMFDCSDNQIIWGCNYFSPMIPHEGRIIHDKDLLIAGTKLKFSEADIASCSMQKRVTLFKYRWGGNVQGQTINWDNTGPDARTHPTQKPIALMIYCIENYSDENHTILDPFMGSGTTGVACVNLGRKFIGIEIEERYFSIACKRIRAAYNQGDLFREKKNPEVIQEGFDLG